MKQTAFSVAMFMSLAMLLSGCQSNTSNTVSSAQKQCAPLHNQGQAKRLMCSKDRVAERSKHQADHGASAEHRAAFIDEYDTNMDEQVAHAEFSHARAQFKNDGCQQQRFGR
jgi:hypothetical protein